MCGKKKSRRDQGNTWWWNEEVNETIARKKVAFKKLCRFPSEENKTHYKSIRNQTRKIVARAMKMEANKELNDLYQNSNSVFYFLRRMKKEGKALNETVEAMQKMKSGKATEPSEVSVEMVVASGEIEVKVMMKLCQHVLDSRGMPDEWKTSVIVPIVKGKSDVISCGSYRGVKLPEHAMKIVANVL